MSWVLLGLLATLIASNITSGIWLHGANKEKDRARDTAEKWQEAANKSAADNRLLEATNKALQGELDKTTKLKVAAEKQRDEAYADAQEFIVERIKAANVADAARLGADILATDIRTGVLSRKRKAQDPRDALIDPFAEG